MKFTVSSALAVIALFSCPHSALAQADRPIADLISQFPTAPFPGSPTSTSTAIAGTPTTGQGDRPIADLISQFPTEPFPDFPTSTSTAIAGIQTIGPGSTGLPLLPFGNPPMQGDPFLPRPSGSPRWPPAVYPGHRGPSILWPHPKPFNFTGIPRTPRPTYDRVQWLADRASIEQLNSDYAFALDSKRFDDLDTLFVFNASYNIPILNIHVEGVAAIKKAVAGSIMKMHTQHVFTQPSQRIDTTSGTATSRIYLTESIYGQNGAPVTRTARGYFEDVLVRTRNGMHYPELEWRFVSRSFTILLPSDPAPPAAAGQAVSSSSTMSSSLMPSSPSGAPAGLSGTSSL